MSAGSKAVAAGRSRRVQRPGHGGAGRCGRAGDAGGAPVQPAGACWRKRCTGTCWRCIGVLSTGCVPPARSPLSGSTVGLWITVCLMPTVCCSGILCTIAMRGPSAWPSRCGRRCPPRRCMRSPDFSYAPFNTLYQLVAARGSVAMASARQAMLIPDLMGYWLTGVAGTELTNASTTQLLDASSRTWSTGRPAARRGSRPVPAAATTGLADRRPVARGAGGDRFARAGSGDGGCLDERHRRWSRCRPRRGSASRTSAPEHGRWSVWSSSGRC